MRFELFWLYRRMLITWSQLQRDKHCLVLSCSVLKLSKILCSCRVQKVLRQPVLSRLKETSIRLVRLVTLTEPGGVISGVKSGDPCESALKCTSTMWLPKCTGNLSEKRVKKYYKSFFPVAQERFHQYDLYGKSTWTNVLELSTSNVSNNRLASSTEYP